MQFLSSFIRISALFAFILCNFHVRKWKNAYIKDLNSSRILINFLCIYLGGERGGGCTNAWICMGTHSQLLLQNCSWSLTSVVVFRSDRTRGGSRAGQK